MRASHPHRAALPAVLLAVVAVLALTLAPAAGAKKGKGKGALKAPVSVKVSQPTATTLKVSWKPRSKARFFQVKGKPGVAVVKAKKNAKYAYVAGLAPNKKYRFGVRACKSKKKCSKYSRKAKGRTGKVPSREVPFGYNEQLPSGVPGNTLVRAGGADFIRVPIAWAQIQPSAPPLGLPLPPWLPIPLNWTAMDSAMATLNKLGVKPLWVVSSAPCWAQGKDPYCEDQLGRAPTPAFYDDYANFALRVALRYPGSMGIQVWNEPNIPKFWEPKPNSSNYRTLLRKTAKTASDYGAKVPIVYGAPSPVSKKASKIDPKKIETKEFLRETLGGGVQGLDAAALHPYSFNSPGNQIKNSIKLFDKAAKVLKATVPALPIWVTEIGFTTAGKFKVPPAEQAAALSKVYESLLARSADLISVHRFYDDADPPFRFEGGMGVVESNRKTVKPAYCSLAVLQGLLPNPCS